MRVYNIKDLQTVKSVNPIEGSIALREMYIWSRWYKPQTEVLFSYQLKHQPYSTKAVKLEYGKTYTFEDIRLLLGSHFNKLDTVCDLKFDGEGKVNLDFKTRYNFENLKLCKELVFELQLPYKETYDNKDGKVTIGTTAINEDNVQLTFSDTDLLYVSCEEINETNVIHRNKTSNLMAVVPIKINPENKRLIKFRDNKPLFHDLTERKTVYNLHFSIRSERGNQLPFSKAFLVVLNKP